ncbi:hypothetical protein Tco_1200828 [Tanacetum coccineum]
MTFTSAMYWLLFAVVILENGSTAGMSLFKEAAGKKGFELSDDVVSFVHGSDANATKWVPSKVVDVDSRSFYLKQVTSTWYVLNKINAALWNVSTAGSFINAVETSLVLLKNLMLSRLVTLKASQKAIGGRRNQICDSLVIDKVLLRANGRKENAV